MYAIKIKPSALKELKKLPESIKDDVITAVELLKTEPRGTGTRKLAGRIDSYRLRVRDYRVLFLINDEIKVITIMAVSKRDKAYK